MLNSIGLQNPGIDGFLEDHLPQLEKLGVAIWVSVGGFGADDYAHVCGLLDGCASVSTIELNLSCPNVEEAPETAAELVCAARTATGKPLYAKLSPATWDIADTARAVADAGADGLSLVNTIRGLAVEPTTFRPRLGRGAGGYSGPALRPIALACVAACARAVDLPIIGMGGVARGSDALELAPAEPALSRWGRSCSRIRTHRRACVPSSRSKPRLEGYASAVEIRGVALEAATPAASYPVDNAKTPANRAKHSRLTRGAILLDSCGSWSRRRHAQAPARSLDQRMEALQRANDVRVQRAQLKRDRSGPGAHRDHPSRPAGVRLDRQGVRHADGGAEVRPRQAARLLNTCRISQSKTVGGLSERQRTELVDLFNHRS